MTDILNMCLSKLRGVKKNSDGTFTAYCPFHPDGEGKPPHKANLKIWPITEAAKWGGFNCSACGQKGNLWGLSVKLGIDPKDTNGSAKDDRRILATYPYHDENGGVLFEVVRFEPKDFRQRRPDGQGGWVWNLKGVRQALYRLPDLIERPDEIVFLVEGEKDADRLAAEGLVATTCPGGAGKWRHEYTETLRDRYVAILPDNDPVGLKHAESVARALTGVAAGVRVVKFDGVPEKGDISDWLDQGHTAGDLLKLSETAAEWKPNDECDEEDEEQPRSKKSQALRLVEIANRVVREFFRDQAGQTFARVPVEKHIETWPLTSHGFKTWLSSIFFRAEGKVPNAAALKDALCVLDGGARFSGDVKHTANRVALHDGALWYDLSDKAWRAVRIDAKGWKIVSAPPPVFQRFAHQAPQVEPNPKGDVFDLLKFVNLPDDGSVETAGQRMLFLTCVVTAFLPQIAHPLLLFHGPQGSAKTTTCRLLKRLVDPSGVESLASGRDQENATLQLLHHWFVPFDNCGTIPGWLSDTFCRAVTGEGFQRRKLYTDNEITMHSFRRCLAINGIHIGSTRADFLDRAVLIGLERIPQEGRKPEAALLEEFEADRPGILGGIFNTLSEAMGRIGQVQLGQHSRMADFERWGFAIAESLTGGNIFLEAYRRNRALQNEEALDSSPVARTVRILVERHAGCWEGTPEILLRELRGIAEEGEIDIKHRSWPKAAHVLTRRIKEVRPNLAEVGIVATYSRTKTARVWRLESATR